MTLFLILNALLALSVLVVILGLLGWAISADKRDTRPPPPSARRGTARKSISSRPFATPPTPVVQAP